MARSRIWLAFSIKLSSVIATVQCNLGFHIGFATYFRFNLINAASYSA